MWIGSQVDYATGSLFLGIVTAFAGMVGTLFITLAAGAPRGPRLEARPPRRRLRAEARGARAHLRRHGGIAVVGFTFWFFIIAGPGPR
jgi:hypothetical protein